MKITLCDQCGIAVKPPRVWKLRIDNGSSLPPPTHAIKKELDLCEKCYFSWMAVVKYVLTLDGLKDCLNRSRGL